MSGRERIFLPSDFDDHGNLLPGYTDQEGRHQRFDQPIRIPLPDGVLEQGMAEYQAMTGRITNGGIH
ncbi:MAG: hypothetical protein ACSLE1_01925 [Sphingobium sp.]